MIPFCAVAVAAAPVPPLVGVNVTAVEFAYPPLPLWRPASEVFALVLWTAPRLMVMLPLRFARVPVLVPRSKVAFALPKFTSEEPLEFLFSRSVPELAPSEIVPVNPLMAPFTLKKLLVPKTTVALPTLVQVLATESTIVELPLPVKIEFVPVKTKELLRAVEVLDNCKVPPFM